jgi:hypothetical protein
VAVSFIGGGPGENQRRVESHWQTLSHNVVHLALIEIWTHNIVTPTTIKLYENNNRTRLLIHPVVEVLLLFLLVLPPAYRNLLIEWLVFNTNFCNISAISRRA